VHVKVKNTTSGGFTLIETLVTIAILGLVMGLFTANYKAMFSSSRLSAAAHGLGDHFVFTVSRSYTTGKGNTLMFDLTGGRYWIHMGSEEDTEARDVCIRSLGKGIKFTDIQVGNEKYEPPGTLSIEVSPLGVTSDFVVNIEDDREKQFAVAMNSLVQSVRYYEEYTDYATLQTATPE